MSKYIFMYVVFLYVAFKLVRRFSSCSISMGHKHLKKSYWNHKKIFDLKIILMTGAQFSKRPDAPCSILIGSWHSWCTFPIGWKDSTSTFLLETKSHINRVTEYHGSRIALLCGELFISDTNIFDFCIKKILTNRISWNNRKMNFKLLFIFLLLSYEASPSLGQGNNTSFLQ